MELSTATRELRVDGQPQVIGARAFDLLVALVENRGRVVARRELLDTVWPSTIVEENNLAVHVSALRKVLGPSAITTVAGRGYRFTLDPQEAPASGAIAGPEPLGNLPAERAGFIGRAVQLAACKALLCDARLLTLTGIGGSGKSRLAIHLAREFAGAFRDGVWFVDLAATRSPSHVPLAVLATFRALESDVPPPQQQVARLLRDRRALLVLDNCEHVLPGVRPLVDSLLATCPDVRILATSRERLALPGEQGYPVEPMSLPAGSDLASIAAAEAVQLFLDRARSSEPHFRLAQDNAAAVAAICRRLDGLPLAIELAAARTSVLTAAEINERLVDRFRLLRATAPGPHRQALSTVLEWSYAQLSPAEQALLRRLTTFTGGWSLRAAARVAPEAGDELDVLDLLTQLAEHSLINRLQAPDAQARYTMLETVREFVQEKLVGAGEEREARTRHLAACRELAREAAPGLTGPDQARWHAFLEADHENLLAAMEWAARDGSTVSDGLEIFESTKLYWRNAGRLELGYRAARALLDRSAGPGGSWLRARTLGAAGLLGFVAGHYVEARALADESLESARTTGDRATEVAALHLLGSLDHAEGRDLVAEERLRHAAELARSLGEYGPLVGALGALAEFERAAGRSEVAAALYEEVASMAHRQGDRIAVAIALFDLAQLAIARGDIDGVPAMLLDVLETAVTVNSPDFLGGGVVEAAAALAAASGDPARAARYLGAVEEIAGRIGYRRGPADAHFLDAMMDRARQAHGAAAFAAAERDGRALARDAVLAEIRHYLEQCRSVERARGQ